MTNSNELKHETSRIEAMIESPGLRDVKSRARENTGFIRPRNAATMILLDGSGDSPRILMGRRNKALKFMPGALVFPGGAVDPNDGSVLACDDLTPNTSNRLVNHMRGRPTRRSARALAIAAIRETAEESGLLIGKNAAYHNKHADWKTFCETGTVPSLAGIRLFSRAITPPGQSRRFDAWFFVARISTVAHIPEGGFSPSGELEDLQWITPQKAMSENTREITRVMLVELIHRLQRDVELSDDYPAPFYQMKNRRFQKIMI